jgi:List-Bact-rpt repeat protein
VVAVASCALAWSSASLARPTSSAAGHAVTAARCAPLTLKKGGAGLLKLTPVRGSLKIVDARLAPGTKAKTKARTITKVGAAAFRYKLSKQGTKGETVRVLVGFGQGKKVAKWKTVSCSVRLGKPAVSLTVAVAGAGDGTVSSAPGGITCTTEKSPCDATLAAGTRVRLTAEPAQTSTFSGWSGACSGTGQCAVTLSAAKTVTATFANKVFAVTITKAGDGGGNVTSTGSPLNCGGTCSSNFEAGTVVRLKAEPDGSSRFVGWTGDVCSSTATQCIFTVDGATEVTATFTKKGNRLNVARAGNGGGTITANPSGVDCGTTCSFTYNADTVVTLTATPDSTSLFAGWTGADCQSASGATCTLTMNSTKFIAATFTRGVTFSVAVSTALGDGTGTIRSDTGGLDCDERGPAAPGNTCSGLFFPDGLVNLTATADPGSTFVSWDNCPSAAGTLCQGTGSDFATAGTVTAHFSTP